MNCLSNILVCAVYVIFCALKLFQYINIETYVRHFYLRFFLDTKSYSLVIKFGFSIVYRLG